jgi:hypothetical protein
MVVDVPKIEMAQYLFNDIKFFDKADDFHFTMAFGIVCDIMLYLE